MNNYDGSKVGVPYTRVSRLVVDYPDNGMVPTATIEQAEAVLLADGSVRILQNLGSFKCTLDFEKGDEPIPMVNPNDASELGQNTSLNQAFLAVLAIIRSEQHKAERAASP